MKHRCGIAFASASSLLVFLLFLVFLVSASIAAADPAPPTPTPSAGSAGKTASGIVAALDKSGKSFVLTDDAGGRTTIHWNDATHFAGGEMFQGALVKVHTVQRDEKTLAVSIVVRPAPSY